MKWQEGGQSAVMLAGGMLFPCLPGTQVGNGHVLLEAARAEDERDEGFNSTYCA